MARITKRLVEGLTAADLKDPGRAFIFWDDTTSGFGVRLQPSGARSYVFQYRAGSGRSAPRRLMTLARVGQITPDQARTLAEQARGEVAHGRDPAKEKTDRKKAHTLHSLAELFLAEHVTAKRKPWTISQYEHVLRKYILPELGTRKADEITTAEIARLHAKLKATPYMANRTLAVVGSMFGFARKRHITPPPFINPARDIEKYREHRKERFLTIAELTRLAAALHEAETAGKIGPHPCAAIRLLLFTGARRNEILALKWEHVDFQRGLLLLPDSKTGKKTIVLNAPALKVLADLPRVGVYVIASQSAGMEGEKPRPHINRPWRAICKRARLEGVRLHDLRHTFASYGVGAGKGLPIIGKLLGHANIATTARYSHLDAGPLFSVANVIGSEIARAMDEAPASDDNVVDLSRR